MKVFNYPKQLKILYPGSVWGFKNKSEKNIYLTFDDGPCRDSTKWILNLLAEEQVKATFFCVGNNVRTQPELFRKILNNGHAVGNHSMNHLNGFKTRAQDYIKDVKLASNYIPSILFRPPYGKLKTNQYIRLKKSGYKVVFWTVLSYDFDPNLSVDKIISKICTDRRNGDIIVFHDSFKTIENLKKILPTVLTYFKQRGYEFKILT